MTTLRQAVQDYLRMRRNLGFKLRNAGKGLLDFTVPLTIIWLVNRRKARTSPSPC